MLLLNRREEDEFKSKAFTITIRGQHLDFMLPVLDRGLESHHDLSKGIFVLPQGIKGHLVTAIDGFRLVACTSTRPVPLNEPLFIPIDIRIVRALRAVHPLLRATISLDAEEQIWSFHIRGASKQRRMKFEWHVSQPDVDPIERLVAMMSTTTIIGDPDMRLGNKLLYEMLSVSRLEFVQVFKADNGAWVYRLADDAAVMQMPFSVQPNSTREEHEKLSGIFKHVMPLYADKKNIPEPIVEECGPVTLLNHQIDHTEWV